MSPGSKSTKWWMKITTRWQLRAKSNPCSLPKETLPKSAPLKFQSAQRPDSLKSKTDSRSTLVRSTSRPKGSKVSISLGWPDRDSTISNRRTTLRSNISSSSVRNTKASRINRTGSTLPSRCKCWCVSTHICPNTKSLAYSVESAMIAPTHLKVSPSNI